MDCQHLDELYELFLLGALADETSVEISEHLGRGCPRCLEQLREATLSVYLLCRTTRQSRPSPKVKSRLLRRLHKK